MGIGFVSFGNDLLSKDTLTVVGPEAFDEDLGAHRVVIIWGLEETKLVAVLIGPLSTGVVDINFCVTQSRCIIAIVGNSFIFGKIGHSLH